MADDVVSIHEAVGETMMVLLTASVTALVSVVDMYDKQRSCEAPKGCKSGQKGCMTVTYRYCCA